MTCYRIADVCGTLVRDETTTGFLRWYFARRDRRRLWLLSALSARFSPLRVAIAVLERILHRDLLKHLRVRLLRGEPLADIDASADAYAQWLLEHRRVEAVRRLLEAGNADGPLVLASASLEPVVAALARRLGALYVANRLACRDGRCLGAYASDLTGRKPAALDRLLPRGWRQGGYLAVSDNASDRALLEGAGAAWVVLHRPRHRRRFDGLDARYLDA